MKKKLFSALLALAVAAAPAVNVQAANMYRMYNPHSGEHFYTAAKAERNHLLVAGWDYEGVGWNAPDNGSNVYRLYNPNAGDHHYTVSAGERDSLVKAGWRYEGVGWKSGGTVPLYRQYNPNAKTGTHNYTAAKAENDYLARIGWSAEGIGWYGIPLPAKGGTNVSDGFYIVEMTTNSSGQLGSTGFMRNLIYDEDTISFYGQAYRGGTQTWKPYYLQDYTFEFADDCLFYMQPTDIAPREINTRDDFRNETVEQWNAAQGYGSGILCMEVQNGYVTYAYHTS